MDRFHAGRRATTFHRNRAFVALDEQQMTRFVRAIRMRVARFPALMAVGNDVVSDPLTQTLVEHEILAYELALQTFGFDLSRVFNDSAFELVDVLKTFMLKVGAG